MENRIDTLFKNLADQGGRTAFIAYVSAGDPDMDRSLEVLHALDRAGTDLIEIGVPFSDPLADGIVNQNAAQRALEAGATTPKVFDLIRRFREKSQTPIVLYTYMNPMFAYGFEKFQTDAAEAGADGALMLDLPPDEQAQNTDLSGASPLRQIRLIAPTTPADRITEIAAKAEGFLYYVSQLGVTGARSSLPENIEEQVAAVKASSAAPVVVGFGISTPEQAATVARLADGVVVGSAIVRQIEENQNEANVADKVHDFVKPLVDAVHGV